MFRSLRSRDENQYFQTSSYEDTALNRGEWSSIELRTSDRGLIPSLLESIRTSESKEEHSPAIRVPISRWSFAFPIKGTAKITPRAPRLAILSLPVRPVDVPSRKGYHVDEFWPAGVPYTRPFTFAANRRVARARLPSFAAWSACDFLPRISH